MLSLRFDRVIWCKWRINANDVYSQKNFNVILVTKHTQYVCTAHSVHVYLTLCNFNSNVGTASIQLEYNTKWRWCHFAAKHTKAQTFLGLVFIENATFDHWIHVCITYIQTYTVNLIGSWILVLSCEIKWDEMVCKMSSFYVVFHLLFVFISSLPVTRRRSFFLHSMHNCSWWWLLFDFFYLSIMKQRFSVQLLCVYVYFIKISPNWMCTTIQFDGIIYFISVYSMVSWWKGTQEKSRLLGCCMLTCLLACLRASSNDSGKMLLLSIELHIATEHNK